MKKVISVLTMAIVFLFAVSVMAQNKVVVIPLGSSSAPMLACVTGGYGQVEPCSGKILISSQNNITVNSPDEVFHTWQSAVVFEDDIKWGLHCNDGWINTGCSGSGGSSAPFDIPQYENGCNSGDDEYFNLVIFTTCCKIVF